MSNNKETIKHTPSFRVYAYLRTSTEEQDPNRAKEELIEFAKEHNVTISRFFVENASGTTLDRPELLRLIDATIPGDILLVEHMDRLTRLDRKDWKSLFALLKSKGIFIVSVGLPTTHNFFNIEFRKMHEKFPIMEMINDLIVEIMAQFAYEDNARRKIRIVQGLENAKKRGVVLGRRKGELGKRLKEKEPSIIILLKNKMGSKAIAKELSVCQLTVLRIAKKNNLQWLGHELGWVQEPKPKNNKI